jgi:hypothetical protein
MRTVVKMSAGGENGSANGKRGGGGAVELWEEAEHPKEPARRVERPDVAAKIAKVSEELKQDVRPPPPPAMITVGGVNEAKAYVPAIVPSEQPSPKEDSQRVRIVDPRQAQTEQLDREALLEASRRAEAAEKALLAGPGEAAEEAPGTVPARIYWIAIGIAIGLAVVVVPLLWMLWRTPEPRPVEVRAPEGTAEASSSAAPVLSSALGAPSGELAPPVAEAASASPALSAAPEGTAVPGVTATPGTSGVAAAPSVKPAVAPSAKPLITPSVKPTVKPSASSKTPGAPSSAPTGIPSEMVN